MRAVREAAVSMTPLMKHAVELLERSRATEALTDDGVATTEATFYDSEVDVAYVNLATARALVAQGICEWVDHDPEHGSTLRLTG